MKTSVSVEEACPKVITNDSELALSKPPTGCQVSKRVQLPETPTQTSSEQTPYNFVSGLFGIILEELGANPPHEQTTMVTVRCSPSRKACELLIEARAKDNPQEDDAGPPSPCPTKARQPDEKTILTAPQAVPE